MSEQPQQPKKKRNRPLTAGQLRPDRRHMSRPQTQAGEWVQININFRPEQLQAMETEADKRGQNRSDFIREAIDLLIEKCRAEESPKTK